MECAGRGLSFWAYQTTQDIYYKQHLYRALDKKYSSLMISYESLNNNFNTELSALQTKLASKSKYSLNFEHTN